MRRPKLITIRFSHYCEKARWALQRAGLDFKESYHAPGFHLIPAMLAGGRRLTPILVKDDGVLNDSTDILRYADEHGAQLLPTDPVERDVVLGLEDTFDERLGPAVRRCVYFHLFQTPDDYVRDMLSLGGTPLEARLMRVVHRRLRAVMVRGLNIRADAAERSRVVIEEVRALVEARLQDGRPYLTGSTFTAADLTFCALFSPLVLAPEYGAPQPSAEGAPPPLAELIGRYRETVAGQFVLRVYREQRHVVLPASAPSSDA
ncbi:MAG: glutathione S-transferase [Myxococcales bacterium]|nr:glutathione S-transferase [Myxococcales bacterium]